MWEEQQVNNKILRNQQGFISSILAHIVFVFIDFIHPYFGMRFECLQSYVAPCLKTHLGNIQLREANGVYDYIKERTIKIGNHVVETRETVRMIAKEFGVSKSTVHKDLTERLPEINPLLANRVKEILEYHKSIRHIRGGEATRKKYKQEGRTECDAEPLL